MSVRFFWLLAAALAAFMAAALIGRPARTAAQSPASLNSETLLSLVLPLQPDGSRPGVHMWARADQSDGPGGLPTVFVVTLLTMQTAGGPEEHEVVNYVQYSSGNWTAARPRDAGTLLVDDWAWISLNLANLTATVSGQGDASRYTVDYDAMGSYAGSQRELQIEEVYGADLSLLSSAVLSDTQNGTGATSGSSASPSASPAATATRAAPAGTGAAATARPRATPSGSPSPSGSATSPAGTPTPSATGGEGTNTIRPASPTP